MEEGVAMEEKSKETSGSTISANWVGTAYVAAEFGIHTETARRWIARKMFGEPFAPNRRTLLVLREFVDAERARRQGGGNQ